MPHIAIYACEKAGPAFEVIYWYLVLDIAFQIMCTITLWPLAGTYMYRYPSTCGKVCKCMCYARACVQMMSREYHHFSYGMLTIVCAVRK